MLNLIYSPVVTAQVISLTDKFIEVHSEFQTTIAQSINDLSEIAFLEQYREYSHAKTLFDSYKEGGDVEDFLRDRIVQIKKNLERSNLNLTQDTSPELYSDYLEFLSEIEQLEADVNFYFGPVN